MRRYLYLEAADAKALGSVKGCRYVEDAHRGHGPELWIDDAVMPQDYPAKVSLVTSLPGGVFQIAPIDPSASDRLLEVLKGSGLVVYLDAKSLDAAKPAVTAVACYEQAVDRDGKPLGKAAGATLRVACCLAGDDAEKAAQPVALEVAKDEEPIALEEDLKVEP